MTTYADVYRTSLSDPEQFWLTAAGMLGWHQAPTQALDGSDLPSTDGFPTAN